MLQHIGIASARLNQKMMNELTKQRSKHDLYLVEAGVVEHVLAPALDDGGVGWDVAVGCQDLQTVATKGYVTPEIVLMRKRETIYESALIVDNS